MKIHYVDPVSDLGALLLTIEKPARYSGGEYGRLAKREAVLQTLIAFPDLYEIGMSNQAFRILYNRLNRMDDISCDRAFAPAPDFEELLKREKLPLYGLDTGISLKDVDVLMFTLGYELGISGFFSMLDVSGIPLLSRERGEDDPIVIMGGPCVSNPLPYAAYIDAFWIGEAEGGFFDLAGHLAEIKKKGGKKRELFNRLAEHESVWTKGKGRAVRAVDWDFSAGKNGAAVFPVAGMKIVQQHGAVEIMRGCPNGCRFCHAGYWYRPMRQKDASLVEAETEAFIREGGYREITLSSLSSGDYSRLDSVIESLNAKYRGRHISFQLPSLRVSSFSLGLLEKISAVRKSGLTFAVETPAAFWQMAINKQVSGEDVVAILREAKLRGWKNAKFYFMIGLPLEECVEKSGGSLKSEEEEIAAFVERTASCTGMRFNINVGTFVPKPHTPFQWAPQLGREESERKLNYLRTRLKAHGHKVGIQDPMISAIEGIVSRGDERAGDFFLEAYKKGCRLDSWTEYLKREIWEELLERYKSLADEILGKKDTDLNLPWNCIETGISNRYLKKELNKSKTGEITLPCKNNCNDPCGICDLEHMVVQNIIQDKVTSKIEPGVKRTAVDPDTNRIIFSFSKQGSAVFHSHLGIIEIFSMAFVRSGIPVLYTRGFNPLPKLEIASPLSLGIKAKGEIAAIDTEFFFEAEKFKVLLNSFLPDGFRIEEVMNVFIPSGIKKHSVMSLLWGFAYKGKDGETVAVKAKEEKNYRESQVRKNNGENGNIYELERLSVLAIPDIKNNTGEFGISYFELYKSIRDYTFMYTEHGG